MYIPTQRTYPEKRTGEIFRMYHNSSTGRNKLISEKTGKEVKNFIISAFTAIDYKFNIGEIISLDCEFIEVTKDFYPTHQKFIIQKRFKKL